ncbi:hypothetical protein [Bradyrhizobium sp. BR 1432]|uniref:hypothetical protein n=1 Tax=Bradyrhizobium sp. BR 1432 TaxID=3447966 RepID=UPI003EE7AF20
MASAIGITPRRDDIGVAQMVRKRTKVSKLVSPHICDSEEPTELMWREVPDSPIFRLRYPNDGCEVVQVPDRIDGADLVFIVRVDRCPPADLCVRIFTTPTATEFLELLDGNSDKSWTWRELLSTISL